MTLSVLEVAGILSRRAYRPGWHFRAYQGDTTRAVMIEVLATVEDSYHPGQGVPLDIYSEVPSFVVDEDTFDAWFAWRLQRLEVHESQEWYRKPGRDLPWVPVYNPHRDGADRDQWPIEKRTRPDPEPFDDAWREGRRSAIPTQHCGRADCPVCSAIFPPPEGAKT